MNIVTFEQDSQPVYLPLKVVPVQTPIQARAALQLRYSAYARHDYNEEIKARLRAPDDADLGGIATTLVAIRKVDGAVVGTVRIMSSMDGLPDFPSDMPEDPCLEGAYAYIDRFATDTSAPEASVAAAALMKATWLWALGRDARWLVALARAPLARHYRRYGGLTVRAEGAPVYMLDYHAKPYFLVAAQLGEALQRLLSENPQHGSGFISKVHPDIKVTGEALLWGEVPPLTKPSAAIQDARAVQQSDGTLALQPA
jgi:hypothetical protein